MRTQTITDTDRRRFEEALASADPDRALYRLAVTLRDEGMGQVPMYRFYIEYMPKNKDDDRRHDAIVDTLDVINGGPWAKGHDLFKPLSLPDGSKAPAWDDIHFAAERIGPLIHRTPVLTSRSIDELAGCRLRFKCENFQRGGAFKFRGAANAVLSLSNAEAKQGVATHSSGNHAAALALAAQCRGIPAYVVLPTTAPEAKRQAAIRYGAKVIPCGSTLADREEAIKQVLAETGANFVHPYDDNRVIAGQGTAALEFLEEVPGLTCLLAPVSGGGLMSGTAIAARAMDPAIELFGAEPGNADDARRSFASGRVEANTRTDTVADGLRAQLSERTLAILRPLLRDVLTVSEEQIVGAMRMVWERLKVVVEPSGAVPLAAVLANREVFQGKEVGVILSGGNLDLDRLPWQ